MRRLFEGGTYSRAALNRIITVSSVNQALALISDSKGKGKILEVVETFELKAITMTNIELKIRSE